MTVTTSASASISSWLRTASAEPVTAGATHDGEHRKRTIPHGTRAGSNESGADDRVRTGDLNLGKVALYQLSYVRSGPQ